MIHHIKQVLPRPVLDALREALMADTAPWVDGRATAGFQGAAVKFNRQLDEHHEVTKHLQAEVLAHLEIQPQFISAALPNQVYPPLFNTYGTGMAFDWHVDGSMRIVPGSGHKLRTDLSATLFLNDPDDYEGGELEIQDDFGTHRVKLPAGDMVLYPATSVHRVTPVTRGLRLASFFWVQSLIRDHAERDMLHTLDKAIQSLHAPDQLAATRVTLTGLYHNLVRRWGAP